MDLVQLPMLNALSRRCWRRMSSTATMGRFSLPIDSFGYGFTQFKQRNEIAAGPLTLQEIWNFGLISIKRIRSHMARLELYGCRRLEDSRFGNCRRSLECVPEY